jgi:hypothetical protein
MNERDLVKCAYCSGKFYNWSSVSDSETPETAHKKYFPKCPHVARLFSDAAAKHRICWDAKSPQNRTEAAETQKSTNAAETQNPTKHTAPNNKIKKKNIKTGEQWPLPTNIDMKWVRSRLDLDWVKQAVLRKGVDEYYVICTLWNAQVNGDEITNAVDLVRKIYELEDRLGVEPEVGFIITASDDEDEIEEGVVVTTLKDTGLEAGGDNIGITEEEARFDPTNDIRFQRLLPKERDLAMKLIGLTPTPANYTEGPKEKHTSPPVNTKPLTCVICRNNRVGVLFLECNHMCSCPECAVVTEVCPVCNKKIKIRVRVYTD